MCDGYDECVPDDNDFDDLNEAVDSCEDCGVNIYADEYDGTHLCGQCQWFIAAANGRIR